MNLDFGDLMFLTMVIAWSWFVTEYYPMDPLGKKDDDDETYL